MIKKVLTIIVTLLVLILVWQFLEVYLNQIRISHGQTGLEAFIPLPSTIWTVFVNNWQMVSLELLYTLARAAGGFVLGTSFGYLLAILLNYFPLLRHPVLPIFYGINAFPIMGFAPLIILIFGQGSALGIVFISALICFFPTLINIDSAIRHCSPDLVEFFTMLKASKWQVLTKIQLPLALPALFIAMRISIPASIIGATMGEWLGARNGIGQLITVALYQLKPGILYAALIILTLVSLVLTGILFLIEKRVLPWKYYSK